MKLIFNTKIANQRLVIGRKVMSHEIRKKTLKPTLVANHKALLLSNGGGLHKAKDNCSRVVLPLSSPLASEASSYSSGNAPLQASQSTFDDTPEALTSKDGLA